jgi:Ca2+-binding EF-hand superfamily protein
MLTAGLIGAAIASHHYHGYGMHMTDMSKMDNNKDNLINFDEFSASHLDMLRSAFNMLDTDNDELIDQKEWNQFLKVHGYGEKYNRLSRFPKSVFSETGVVGLENLNTFFRWPVLRTTPVS